jgi:hypothetical protein
MPVRPVLPDTCDTVRNGSLAQITDYVSGSEKGAYAIAMGFLNLSAWRPVGGRRVAERRARSAFAQPPRYYYENLRDFQSTVDRFFEVNGHRPKDVAELYLWQLQQAGMIDDDERALDLADLFSYYDIEPNSLLAMVNINQNHQRISEQLLEARRTFRMQGHRPPQRVPIEVGLA